MIDQWKTCARRLKQEIHALYLAYRDPRTPWYARLFTAIVLAYAFSPIDLIPDFIPVLAECRHRARTEAIQEKPVNRVAMMVIIGIWISLAVWIGTTLLEIRH